MGNCSSEKVQKNTILFDSNNNRAKNSDEGNDIQLKSTPNNQNKSTTPTPGPTNQEKTKVPTDKEEDLKISNGVTKKKDEEISPFERYELLRNGNNRNFGKSYIVKQKDTGYLRMIKELKEEKGTETKVKEFQKEYEVLKQLDHPKVIKIYEYYVYRSKHYIVTEYMEQGELFEKMSAGEKFDEAHAAQIIYQILQAVAYCHAQGVIHRDLKPENILIESIDRANYYSIKIIDFGTSALSKSISTKKSKEIMGSGYYIAPEVLTSNYNEKCDIWSIGVILYILMSGTPPFIGDTDKETFHKIETEPLQFTSKKWEKISQKAKDFIKKMLDRNVNKRMSAVDALNDPWFQKFMLKEKSTTIESSHLNNYLKNLQTYNPNYKLQEAAMALIVHNLPATEEIRELEKTFRLLDKNYDGKLSREELKEGLSQHFKGNKELDFESTFKRIDNDGSGDISYEEFIRACIDKSKLLSDENLLLAFNYFDTNSSGFISIKEIKELFYGSDKKISNRFIEGLVKGNDSDEDGEISLAEFKEMMRRIVK